MYEFTLLKSMFFELDKYKIEGVTQTKEKQRTFRRLEVSYDSVPCLLYTSPSPRD